MMKTSILLYLLFLTIGGNALIFSQVKPLETTKQDTPENIERIQPRLSLKNRPSINLNKKSKNANQISQKEGNMKINENINSVGVKTIDDFVRGVQNDPVLIDITDNDEFLGVVNATIEKLPKNGDVIVYPAWTRFPVFNHKSDSEMPLDPETGGLINPHPLDNETLFFQSSGDWDFRFSLFGAGFSDNYLAIASQFEGISGAVYIYERKVNNSGKIYWQFIQKLVSSEIRVNDEGMADPNADPLIPQRRCCYARPVKINNGQLFIGDQGRKIFDELGNEINRGVVYVYELSTSDILGNSNPDIDGDGDPDELWIFKQRLESTEPQPPEQGSADFGEFFDIDGNWAFISSNNHDLEVDGEHVNVAGIFEIFKKQVDGTWIHKQTFLDPDNEGPLTSANFDFWGSGVDLKGDYGMVNRAPLPFGPSGEIIPTDDRRFIYKLNHKEDIWELFQDIEKYDDSNIVPNDAYTGFSEHMNHEGSLILSTQTEFYDPSISHYLSVYQRKGKGQYELTQTLEQPNYISNPEAYLFGYGDVFTREDLMISHVTHYTAFVTGEDFESYLTESLVRIWQMNKQKQYVVINEIKNPEWENFNVGAIGWGLDSYAANDLFMYISSPFGDFRGSIAHMYSTHPIIVYIPEENSNASDMFKYSLEDPSGNSDIAIVHINKSSNNNEGENLNMRLIPNPTNYEVNVELPLLEDQFYTIYVYDLAGIMVHTERNQGGTINIKLLGNKPGIYLVRAISPNQEGITKMLVID